MLSTHVPPAAPPEKCPSCGADFVGKYCHACGEKRLSAKDFRVSKYARALFEHFSHFDSKLLRTLWLLASKPGFLTAEFVAGRRNRYLKPLQVFLLANLAFFFLFEQNDVFAPKLKFIYRSEMRDWSGQSVRELTDAYALREQISTETAIETIDTKSGNYTKGLLYLIVPALALVCHALFFRQNPYFLCSLIFATHWLAFLLVFIMSVGAVVVGGFGLHGVPVLASLLALLMPYHYLATRHFFGQPAWVTGLKTVPFFAAFVLIYLLYREFILFLTLHTI